MAIERYVASKEHKDEARRAARVLETAVGEALGPVTRDHDRRPGAKLHASNIAPHDASRFRLMAAHRDLWWPMAEKALSRRQVLTMIAEATVYENGTLRNAKWVAARYELSSRDDNLPITHNEPSPRRRGLFLVSVQHLRLSKQNSAIFYIQSIRVMDLSLRTMTLCVCVFVWVRFYCVR